MGWLDALQDVTAPPDASPKEDDQSASGVALEGKQPKAAPAEIQLVTVQVRPSNANDPGEVELAWFVVRDGKVLLVTQSGSPIGEPLDVGPTQSHRSVVQRRLGAFAEPRQLHPQPEIPADRCGLESS